LRGQDGEGQLNMGFDVVVFPRGRRSPRRGSLPPLCRGTLEMASRTSVPIVLMKLTVCRAIEPRDRDGLDPARAEANRWPASPRT
jgi:1-acyl-sn-glycerol-3-phosphate acyltransferase